MEIRALTQSDDRSAFSCGNDALDRFFRDFAGQNQFRHFIGVTYVAIEGERIIGFATVSANHLEAEVVPQSKRRLPRYNIPILRLARLAVDTSVREGGVGRALLRFVMELAIDMANAVGCAGVVVDAKPEAVDYYARYGFVTFDSHEGLAPSAPTPMWLPLQAVRDVLAE